MRQLLVIVVALALAAPAAGPAPAAGAVPAPPLGLPVFVLGGSGYGHGVGMSQYGAYGQAAAGRGYRDILGFYYPGTEIASAPVANVRVLLAQARKLVVGSTAGLRVRDAAGGVFELPEGELVLTPKLELQLDGVPFPLTPPVRIAPGRGGFLALGKLEVRGAIHVDAVGALLRAVNVVGLDTYLLGVVPGEMPREWPLEALKAQAVAARTYAVANLGQGKPFDLYADVRSQVYRGARAEAPATTLAVRETAGEIVTWAGRPASTFYHSSSGGRTASALDAFGLDLPYLPTQPDPWDSASPYHVWPLRTVTSAQLRASFELPSPVVGVEALPTPSGRPSVVRLTTRAGGVVDVKPIDVRRRLGLRSTAFRFGVMQLQKGPVRVEAGAAVTLSGVARGVDQPVLEQLLAGVWAPVVRVASQVDGTFTVVVRPTGTTRYRLTAGGLAGPALTVAVAPVAG